MSKQKSWLEQINRLVFPVVVLGVIGYGTWDLLIRDSMKLPQPVEDCKTTIVDVAVFKPGPNAAVPPRRVEAPEGLAIVVPAGEKRLIAVNVINPEEKGVVHQWKAVYGQFESRLTIDPQVTYTAPLALVNDTLTITATRQGCTATQKTLEIAVIPSANAPLPDQSFPSPTLTPAVPDGDLPLPTTLPTLDPAIAPRGFPESDPKPTSQP